MIITNIAEIGNVHHRNRCRTDVYRSCGRYLNANFLISKAIKKIISLCTTETNFVNTIPNVLKDEIFFINLN